jgi:hypothetical protein
MKNSASRHPAVGHVKGSDFFPDFPKLDKGNGFAVQLDTGSHILSSAY